MSASAVSEYNQLRNSLGAANLGFTPPPVIDDQINYTAEALKGGVEGIGAQLAGGTIMKGIKALRKSNPNALKNAGIAEQDVDDVETSAANGDLTGAGASAIRALVGGVNKTLGNAGRRLGGALRDLGEKATGSFDKSVPDTLVDTEDLFKQALTPKLPEGEINPFSINNSDILERATSSAQQSLRGGMSGDQTLARALQGKQNATPENPSPKTPANGDAAEADRPPAATETQAIEGGDKALQSGENLSDTSKTLSTGEKVFKDLKKGDEDITATDFDPVDLAVQGVLAVATIGLGLLIHPHHIKNVAPQPTQPTNYSAQLY